MSPRNVIALLAALSLAVSTGCVRFNSADSSATGDTTTGGTGGGGTGGGGVNLVVPIEMIDAAVASNTGGATDFGRSQTPLNTADYDGTVSYEFEIVARNDSAGGPLEVDLIDEGGTSRSQISVADDGVMRLQAATWTPPAGDHVYRLRLAQTGTARDLSVYSARILVHQQGATRTHLYLPLLGDGDTTQNAGVAQNADELGQTIYVTADSYAFPDSDDNAAKNYAHWIKDSSAYATLSGATPWTLTAVLNAGDGLETAYAALYNVDDGAAVSESEVSTNDSQAIGHALVRASFSNTATNFTEGKRFNIRARTANAGGFVRLGKAGLWVRLENLSKGEIYHRVSKSVTYFSAAVTDDFERDRLRLDPGWYSNPVFYHEKSGETINSAGHTSNAGIVDDGASDSGTGGADLGDAGLTFNFVAAHPTGWVLQRTASLALVDNERHYRPRVVFGSGGFHSGPAYLVVGFSAAP